MSRTPEYLDTVKAITRDLLTQRLNGISSSKREGLSYHGALGREQLFYLDEGLEFVEAKLKAEEALLSEMQFIDIARKFLVPVEGSIDMLYQNALAVDSVVIYEFISYGGLDRMYQKHLASLKNKKYRDELSAQNEVLGRVPENNFEKIEIMAFLTEEFLKRFDSKRKNKMHEGVPELTVGLECEYIDFLSEELQLIYEEVMGIYDQLKPYFGKKLSDFNIEDFLKKNPQIDSKKMSVFLKRFLKISELAGTDTFMEIGRFLNNVDSKNLLPRGTWIGERLPRHPFVDKSGGLAARELVTLPSPSIREQVRLLMLSGSFSDTGRSFWNIHTTWGGCDLTTEHLEMMESTAISCACGWVSSDTILPNDLDEDDNKAEGSEMDFPEYMADELRTKLSTNSDGKAVYFPFHRRRSPQDIVSFSGMKKVATERRSLYKYGKENFRDFIQDVLFTEATALVIPAVQTPSSERSEKQVVLAQLWENFMSEWEAFLSQYKIVRPVNEGYYTTNFENDFKNVPYNKFIADLMIEGIFDTQGFRRDARKLARDFMLQVNKHFS